MTILVENAALREAFRRGDKAALTEVYLAYAEHLFAMLSNGFTIQSAGKRILFKGYKEPFRLEGAVQEIFSRAFSHAARNAYDGLRPYKNYLYTIARNYVVDAYRRGGRSFVTLDTVVEVIEAVEEHAPSRPLGPERSAENRQLKALVAVFLGGLDTAETALFKVRFEEGLTVERSATVLGKTEYWVKRNEKRIKKRFYLFMKNQGYFDGFNYGGVGVSNLLMLMLFAGIAGSGFGGAQ